VIFVQEPEPFQFAGLCVNFADRSSADHFFAIEHAEERPTILEVVFLNIIHIFELMVCLMVGNGLFERTWIIENNMGDAIDNSFRLVPLMGLDGADLYHEIILLQERYNPFPYGH
jgi:hypothetical protein